MSKEFTLTGTIDPHVQKPDSVATHGAMARSFLARCAVVLVLAGGVGGAFAQDAMSVKVGEADLTPEVRLDYLSSTNAYLTPDNETDTTAFIVKPSVTYSASRRLVELELGYSGEYATYSEDALSYSDHALTANATAEFSTRQRARLAFATGLQHEQLGTSQTRGSANADSEQIEYLDTTVDGSYTFGAAVARGNLTGGLFVRSRAFQNREDVTRGDDYAEVTPYGRFSYRLSADTRALVELRFRNFDFDDDTSDRAEMQALTGLSFQGTGKTGGEAKLGITSANYDDDRIEDDTLLTASINLFYLPRSFSRIEVRFERDLNNVDSLNFAPNAAQSIDDSLRLRWLHQWSSFINTRATVSSFRNTRDCPEVGSSTVAANVELGVQARRWLELGAGISSAKRTADNCTDNPAEQSDLDYSRQILNIFVRATL